MAECDHIIGWYTTYNNPDSWPVYLNREDVDDMNSPYANGEYKFKFCPLCGRSINWDRIEEMLRLKEL